MLRGRMCLQSDKLATAGQAGLTEQQSVEILAYVAQRSSTTTLSLFVDNQRGWQCSRLHGGECSQ